MLRNLLLILALALCSFTDSLKLSPPRQQRIGGLLMASSDPAVATPARTYASYMIYKGKGAVAVKCIPPTFATLSQSRNRVVERQGGLLFEFAPSSARREYDWGKKCTFLLDPTECAALVVMDHREGAEFFHDPNMASPDKAGLVTKKMKWSPSQDGRGAFVSLSVTNKGSGADSSMLTVPVTWAELEVVRSILRFSIPRFLGFHEVWANGGLSGDGQPPHGQAAAWNDMGEDMR